jgi:hypothetical protein
LQIFWAFFVEQNFDALARGELTLFMLPGLAFRPAGPFSGLAPMAQFFQAVHRDYCSGSVIRCGIP